jgi:hypothetical protein
MDTTVFCVAWAGTVPYLPYSSPLRIVTQLKKVDTPTPCVLEMCTYSIDSKAACLTFRLYLYVIWLHVVID